MTSKRWRWMPGMLARMAPRGSGGKRWDLESGTARSVRVLQVGEAGTPLAGLALICPADGQPWPSGLRVIDCKVDDLAVPDLTDAATLGCLLALVRKAWDTPTAYCALHPHATAKPWRVFGIGGGVGPGGDTEAEALVCALEAAHDPP